MISEILLKLRIKCDGCETREEIEAWVPWWDFQVVMHGTRHTFTLPQDQLPDLWEYYAGDRLLCPDCQRKWREESVLDQLARKVSEEKV